MIDAIKPYKVVMIGATGAVGGEVLKTLLSMQSVENVTLLTRRAVEGVNDPRLSQHFVDLDDPLSYVSFLKGHTTAISTLGIGEPSSVSRDVYEKTDKDLVLKFAGHCKDADIQHFSALVSVGADSKSASYYLRIKGELEDGLAALGFERLSLFHPSMILTPSNRYGITQAITLKVWPLLKPVLLGPLRKLRGIKVGDLGSAVARNLKHPTNSPIETLEWDDFSNINEAA